MTFECEFTRDDGIYFTVPLASANSDPPVQVSLLVTGQALFVRHGGVLHRVNVDKLAVAVVEAAENPS